MVRRGAALSRMPQRGQGPEQKCAVSSASATSRLPAPRARAIADETPPPMPLAAVCWISITNGKASDTPASASGPRRPRNRPSKVIMPAIASRLRTFGAESRSSVGKTGPSSSNLVRAATGRAAAGPVAAIGENDGRVFVMLRLLIALLPTRAGAAPETEASSRTGRGPGYLFPC